jgi:hypothetical protein
MLSRRRLLRSASAITAARSRADAGGSTENAAAAAKAPDLIAQASEKAETSSERVDDPQSVADAGRLRDATT